MRLQTVGDLLTVVVSIAVLGVLGARFLAPSTTSATGPTDVRLGGPALGVDFTVSSKTLIMALRSDCGFCQESMPFYRQLLAHDRDGLQVVVASPIGDTKIHNYLDSERVMPDDVVFVAAGILPVSGTPTLLAVDSEGLVTHSWLGLLDAEREADVLDVLFGAGG